MKNRQFWSFREAETYRDLFVTDEIAKYESWWSDTVTPNTFRQQLMSGDGEVRVWIDSPGGDAFAGAAIYEILIAMGGDEIRISVLGTIMIHEPWSLTSGRADELRATAEVLESIRQGQIKAYAERSGQTEEKVLELMRGSDGNGTYMNARMALDLGFADRLIDLDSEDGIDAGVAALAHMKVASLAREPGPEPEPEEAPEDDGREEIRSALMRAVLMGYTAGH